MIIKPAKSIRGTVKLPGDKSISHRAAMIAAMAEGETRIENFAKSEDCSTTVECLRQMGVAIRRENDVLIVTGAGHDGFRPPTRPLDCGNSGTTMRLLSGILAGQDFPATLTGDTSLRQRPMNRVIAPLEQMGASIRSTGGRAPLTIQGRTQLLSIGYQSPIASAQIKSCVLFAGLNADGITTVTETTATRDHSERMLKWFGADVNVERVGGQTRIAVDGKSRLIARDFTVPGDISAAAFFLVAAACLHGSAITLQRVGINASRTAVLDILATIGAAVQMEDESEMCGEPVATIRARGGLGNDSAPLLIRGGQIANLIDEVPILAILGTRLSGGIEIRDAAELRVKESDRIGSVVTNLTRMGADVEEFSDGFRVGRSSLIGAQVDSFGDHRIAMAFAVAGLLAEGDTTIVGAQCAEISFPGFFEMLSSVVD